MKFSAVQMYIYYTSNKQEKIKTKLLSTGTLRETTNSQQINFVIFYVSFGVEAGVKRDLKIQ